ncbi:PepSY domain-containing protein [Paenibacillus sp. 102]|uniref:PepSY domain-containing protein n=1 Tax=Paenibacillus sp. 102 TaxID=3120823 RepID=UPI0031BADEAC
MKLGIALLIGFLTIAGTVYGVSAMGHEDKGERVYQEVVKADDEKVKVTREKVGKIALENVDGAVKEIDFDRENGMTVYEVEMDTNEGEKEIYVDAKTGAVSMKEQNDDNDLDDDRNEYEELYDDNQDDLDDE